MKKLVIILASIIGALAVALAVLLLLGRGNKVESGDEESLYPYSYTQNSKSVVLHVGGDLPEGCTWVAREGERVSIEAERKKDGTDFTLRGAGTGSEQLLFTLQRESEGGLTERLYEISVDVYVLNGSIEILSNYHRELAGLLNGSQEGFTYNIASQDDGTLVVELQYPGKATWTPQREGSSVTLDFEEIRQADGYCRIRLTGVEMGQTTMRFCDAEHRMALECFISADAFYDLTVVEHSVVPYVEKSVKK